MMENSNPWKFMLESWLYSSTCNWYNHPILGILKLQYEGQTIYSKLHSVM